jgi:alpha-glucosidase (family GH31 glycosyl hydrolase)
MFIDLLKDESNDFNFTWYSTFTQDKNSTWYLPFVPGYGTSGNFDEATLSLNATHANGETEYNLHNLYGHMMSYRSYEFLTNGSIYN